VFIDALHDQTKQSAERLVQEQGERKNTALRYISELFHQYDEDDSGTLDQAEMDFMFQLFEDEVAIRVRVSCFEFF